MENLDNILYFVLIIAGLIISAMRKKPKNQPEDVYQDEEDPFEQIFGEAVREIKQVVNKEPEPEVQPAPTPVEVIAEPDNYFAAKAKKNAKDALLKTEPSDDFIYDYIKNSEKIDSEESETIDFDLETAIIQTEILNKKY